MSEGNSSPGAGGAAEAPKTSRAGNLVYTRKTLLWLFFWLLWFDFSFVLMESMLQPILQIYMQNELKCDPLLFSIFLATIPAFINFFMNPIISIKSDRHRGPRGRRIPFLLWGTPMVCGCLVLLGFGNEIAEWLHVHWFPGVEETTVTIYTFGSLFLVFCFANMFLGTTWYYLANDVVPREHQVKFMAYIRATSMAASALYSWYFLGYAQHQWGPLHINLGFWSYHSEEFWYPTLILIGAAVFYIVTGTVALLKIKEPDYPPPPPLAAGNTVVAKWTSTCATLFRECFCHKFYILYFLALTVTWMAGQMEVYQTPMRNALGIDFNVLGKVQTGQMVITFALFILAGTYGDRVRPLPLMMVAQVLIVLTAPVALLFLIPGLSSEQYLWIQIAYMVTHIPVDLVGGMAQGPLGFSLMPRERYGQFAAAQSMVRMVVAGITGSLVAGWVMRELNAVCSSPSCVALLGPQYFLRFCFVWKIIFQIGSLICFYLLYREWKKLGGKWHYKPPPVGPESGPASATVAAAEKKT